MLDITDYEKQANRILNKPDAEIKDDDLKQIENLIHRADKLINVAYEERCKILQQLKEIEVPVKIQAIVEKLTSVQSQITKIKGEEEKRSECEDRQLLLLQERNKARADASQSQTTESSIVGIRTLRERLEQLFEEEKQAQKALEDVNQEYQKISLKHDNSMLSDDWHGLKSSQKKMNEAFNKSQNIREKMDKIHKTIKRYTAAYDEMVAKSPKHQEQKFSENWKAVGVQIQQLPDEEEQEKTLLDLKFQRRKLESQLNAIEPYGRFKKDFEERLTSVNELNVIRNKLREKASNKAKADKLTKKDLKTRIDNMILIRSIYFGSIMRQFEFKGKIYGSWSTDLQKKIDVLKTTLDTLTSLLNKFVPSKELPECIINYIKQENNSQREKLLKIEGEIRSAVQPELPSPLLLRAGALKREGTQWQKVRIEKEYSPAASHSFTDDEGDSSTEQKQREAASQLPRQAFGSM